MPNHEEEHYDDTINAAIKEWKIQISKKQNYQGIRELKNLIVDKFLQFRN